MAEAAQPDHDDDRGTSGGEGELLVRRANQASWDDIQTVFGPRGEAHRCQCQWFQTRPADWREHPDVEQRMSQLRDQTQCGHPRARDTTGLVAYLNGEPVGWCAIEPRSTYVHLLGSRVVWAERDEDPADDGVWAVPCFVTRAGYRRRGVSGALLRAAVEHARTGGARALEGYPIVVRPGAPFGIGEMYVGSMSTFRAAGFDEITRPTTRRAVMRIDF